LFEDDEDEDSDEMAWLFPEKGPGKFKDLQKKKKKVKKKKRGKKRGRRN
jgi:hypothetical protein